MIIPSSFQAAYGAERALLEEVRGIAGDRLRSLCDREHWLFDDRIKEPESTLARLQLGDIASLRDVIDFYAAVVVVPTRLQLERAVELVSAEFEQPVTKKERNIDPAAFPYDDIHVTAQLSAEGTRDLDPVRSRRFEIQIRTGLQYAWWWATHDTVYKGGVADWRAHRLASQVRASLELLDDVLAGLSDVARLQPERATRGEDAYRAMETCLEKWAEPQQPEDVHRFCRTVIRYAEHSGLSIPDLIAQLDSGDHDDVISIPGITPAQAVLVTIFRVHGTSFIDAMRTSGLRVLISEEMVTVCEELDAVAAEDRVSLS